MMLTSSCWEDRIGRGGKEHRPSHQQQMLRKEALVGRVGPWSRSFPVRGEEAAGLRKLPSSTVRAPGRQSPPASDKTHILTQRQKVPEAQAQAMLTPSPPLLCSPVRGRTPGRPSPRKARWHVFAQTSASLPGASPMAAQTKAARALRTGSSMPSKTTSQAV